MSKEVENLRSTNADLLAALENLLTDTQNGELATVRQVRQARQAIARARATAKE